MPQRVVIIYMCSLCGTESDGSFKMTPAQIVIENTTLAYDICTACKEGDSTFASILRAGLKEKASKNSEQSNPIVGDSNHCEVCGNIFASVGGLATHRARAHGMSSMSRDAVLARDRGNGPEKCWDCDDYGAKNPQGLAMHRRIRHNDNRPIAEQRAAQGKIRQPTPKPHRRSGFDRVACEHCDSTFARSDGLLRHVRSQHT